MARKKSFGSILDQAERLESNPRMTPARLARVNIAADRYTDNIAMRKSFRGKNAYDRGYSRNTYMGFNAG